MDWKSTAVISGAGVVATWFFSMPPTNTAVAPSARAPQASRSATIDIEKEAARLQVRVPQDAPRYIEPTRNPFRFSQHREPTSPTSGVVAPSAAADTVTPPPPAPPQIALDGVAADQDQRTAIFHTEAGVVLAKEGEDVAGYRVSKIAPDAVELTKISDGSTLRLALR